MNLEEALMVYLKAYTGLTALVSTRIHYDELPQGASSPAVVITKVSDIKDHYLSGQCELERPIYQFTAVGLTKTSVKGVAEQLKAALCDYQGTLSGVVVQKIELQSEYSSKERTTDGTTSIYFEDLEFEIYFIRE